jgi:peptidoglycan/xylan/chitin deacetylase (PgdA/CDA1 family)
MSARLPVLLYHRVGPLDGSAMDRYTVSPARFEAQMRWLVEHGWRAVDLEDAVRRRFPSDVEGAVAITFDDGFASNREFAWPVLAHLGLRASTFLVAGHLGGTNRWDRPADARFPLLSRADIEQADRARMIFHCHSATHVDLPSLAEDPAGLARELVESRARLADAMPLGGLFAYPRGSWTWDVKVAVERAGYVGACTCMDGRNGARTDPFLLRRVEVHEDDVGWRFAAKVRSGRDLGAGLLGRPASLKIAIAWAKRSGGPLPRRLQHR